MLQPDLVGFLFHKSQAGVRVGALKGAMSSLAFEMGLGQQWLSWQRPLTGA